MRRAPHSITRPLTLARAAGKQLKHIATHKLIAIGSRRSRPISQPVYFYPEAPHPYTVCYRTLHRLGIAPKRGWPTPDKPGLVFVWQDDTYMQPTAPEALAQAAGSVLINSQCLDISKARVDAVHQQVFGYSLAVDPTTFTGKMVAKSNLNGEHDGQEIVGPLSKPSTSTVYQRVVNNRPSQAPRHLANHELICDIRVAIFGGKPGFAYLKYRPVSSRFSNTNSHVEIAQLESVFSAQEIALIQTYCQTFGLDYGEIDVVRDAGDGRIYILDINKTPLGPPNGLPDDARDRAIAMYCRAFTDWFKSMRFGNPNSATAR